MRCLETSEITQQLTEYGTTARSVAWYFQAQNGGNYLLRSNIRNKDTLNQM